MSHPAGRKRGTTPSCDVHVPAFGDLIDEDQCLFTLLTRVLEEQVHVRRQSPAVHFEDFVEHMPSGATTAYANLSRGRDQVGIHEYSSQVTPSPGVDL